MDLISREKALADDGLAEFHRYDDYSKMREYLKSLPSAFEGMTNIEIIKAIFPIAEIHTFKDKDGNVTEYVIGFDNDNGMVCPAKWADSPYKR